MKVKSLFMALALIASVSLVSAQDKKCCSKEEKCKTCVCENKEGGKACEKDANGKCKSDKCKCDSKCTKDAKACCTKDGAKKDCAKKECADGKKCDKKDNAKK